MSEHRGDVPRPVLIVAGLVAAATIAFAAYGSITGLNLSGTPDSTPVASVELVFRTQPDGAVEVYDAGTDRLVDTVQPDDNGFIRGAMRALERQRLQQDARQYAPYKVTRWENGRLSLTDTATGAQIYLSAYGETNRKAFARLMRLARTQTQ